MPAVHDPHRQPRAALHRTDVGICLGMRGASVNGPSWTMSPESSTPMPLSTMTSRSRPRRSQMLQRSKSWMKRSSIQVKPVPTGRWWYQPLGGMRRGARVMRRPSSRDQDRRVAAEPEPVPPAGQARRRCSSPRPSLPAQRPEGAHSVGDPERRHRQRERPSPRRSARRTGVERDCARSNNRRPPGAGQAPPARIGQMGARGRYIWADGAQRSPCRICGRRRIREYLECGGHPAPCQPRGGVTRHRIFPIWRSRPCSDPRSS